MKEDGGKAFEAATESALAVILGLSLGYLADAAKMRHRNSIQADFNQVQR